MYDTMAVMFLDLLGFVYQSAILDSDYELSYTHKMDGSLYVMSFHFCDPKEKD